MTLAPSPTTTLDHRALDTRYLAVGVKDAAQAAGTVDVFAAESRSGQPRNAWLAIDFFTNHERTVAYGVEMFGGATREAVAARCTGTFYTSLLIIEAAQHEWRSTPHRKLPF